MALDHPYVIRERHRGVFTSFAFADVHAGSLMRAGYLPQRSRPQVHHSAGG